MQCRSVRDSHTVALYFGNINYYRLPSGHDYKSRLAMFPKPYGNEVGRPGSCLLNQAKKQMSLLRGFPFSVTIWNLKEQATCTPLKSHTQHTGNHTYIRVTITESSARGGGGSSARRHRTVARHSLEIQLGICLSQLGSILLLGALLCGPWPCPVVKAAHTC